MLANVLLVAIVTMTLSDALPDHHHHHHHHHYPRTIKSNAVTNISSSDAAVHRSRHFSDDVHTSRQRRQAQPLTPQQIREIVDIHNVLRAREGANNMERMTWNDFLASTAAGWAAGCNWKHGQPPLGDNPAYTSIGQNLYATTGSVMNLTSAIEHGWYDEKQDYNYDTLECSDVCGHYTAVVWATSRHVGCGYHLCKPLAGAAGFTEALYLVCNYGPAGNYVGVKPYTKGPACSKCGSGAGWCKDRLCNSDCSAPGDDCRCAVHCYNCADWSSRTCRCSCANGWHGVDCSVPCKDTHSYCNANPGWPPSFCGRESVQRSCPAMCAQCTADPSAVADRCPPSYGPYAHQSAPSMFTRKQQTTILLMLLIALTTASDALSL